MISDLEGSLTFRQTAFDLTVDSHKISNVMLENPLGF